MTAQLISGIALSQKIRIELAEKVARWKIAGERAPGLATILVGDDPASHVYVKNKHKACEAVGIHSFHAALPKEARAEEILSKIATYNRDPRIDGILLQLPLPKGLPEADILSTILPEKDVDGFHAASMGALLLGRPGFRPCTPFGVIKMMESLPIDWTGKHAVVVGRSNIVGKPVALLLLEKDMTVTLCHSRTANLAAVVGQADLVVAAVGRPKLISGDWIKAGAVVIDVGINRLPGGELCGDVDFESAKDRAAYITPVPGGVGPMTIAMLLWNTVFAYETKRARH